MTTGTLCRQRAGSGGGGPVTEASGCAVRTPDSLLRGPVSTALTLTSLPAKHPAEIVGILRFFFGVQRRCGVDVSTMDTHTPSCPVMPRPSAALASRTTSLPRVPARASVSEVMTPKCLRSEETAQRVKGATARPNLRPRGASSRRGLAGLSIGAHAPELLRNQRSLGGSPGARPDGVWVSMVLTSTPHRCCTPKKDRRISTILAGCFDGRLGSVGAVDTGPRRSESPWVLPQSPAPFSQVLLHCSRARSLRRVQVVMVGRRFRFESRLE